MKKADQTMIKMLQLYEQLVIAIGNEPDANKVTGTGCRNSGSRKNFCQCKMVHATGI